MKPMYQEELIVTQQSAEIWPCWGHCAGDYSHSGVNNVRTIVEKRAAAACAQRRTLSVRCSPPPADGGGQLEPGAGLRRNGAAVWRRAAGGWR